MKDIVIQRHKCFECDSTENIHEHHVVPKTLGGIKTIPLCGSCHGKVHGKNFGLEWKRLQREGIQKARLAGVYSGRKKGATESKEVFLQKPKTKDIIKDLRDGCTVREIMRMRKCSPGLVMKVKKLI